MGAFQEKLSTEQVFVCKDGIKVIYPKANVVYLMLPPQWNFLAYNTKTRRRFDEKRSVFDARRSAFMLHRQRLPRVGKGVIAGTVTDIYRFQDSSIDFPEALSRSAGIGGPQSGTRKSGFLEYQYSRETLDGSLPDLLAALLWIPDLGGIPLACYRYSSENKKEEVWSAVKLIHRDIPKSTFQVPSNLKPGFGWKEVVEPESGLAHLGDAKLFLDTFDIGGDAAERKPKSK